MSSKSKDGIIIGIIARLNESEDDKEKQVLRQRWIHEMNGDTAQELEDDG